MPTDLLAAPETARPSPGGPVDLLAAAPQPKTAAPPVDLLASAPAAPKPAAPVDLLATTAATPSAMDVLTAGPSATIPPTATFQPATRNPAEPRLSVGGDPVANLTGRSPDVDLADIRQFREQDAANPLLSAALARRGEAGRSVDAWFQRHDPLAERFANDPAARAEFHRRQQDDPFPQDALRLLDPHSQRNYLNRRDESYSRPLIRAAGQVPKGWYVPEHVAESTGAALAGLGPTVAQAKVDVGNAFRQVTGVDNTAFMDRAYQEKRDAESLAEHARREQQFVAEQLPQNPFAQVITGQADFAVKGAAALGATVLTKNPRIGAAMFSGLFAADAAGRGYQEAREAGRTDDEAREDAAFAGIKGAIISRLPMAWPALARETAAVQMAGAYLAGTGITTGDAAADEAYKVIVRGEKPDAGTVERLGMAFLQGGTPAALLHGAHLAGQAGGNAAPDLRTAEPALTRPPSMATPAAPSDTAAVRTGPAPDAAGEFDLQPTMTLRKLARDQGIDPRLSREQLIDALRKPVEKSEPVDLLAGRAEPQAATSPQDGPGREAATDTPAAPIAPPRPTSAGENGAEARPPAEQPIQPPPNVPDRTPEAPVEQREAQPPAAGELNEIRKDVKPDDRPPELHPPDATGSGAVDAAPRVEPPAAPDSEAPPAQAGGEAGSKEVKDVFTPASPAAEDAPAGRLTDQAENAPSVVERGPQPEPPASQPPAPPKSLAERIDAAAAAAGAKSVPEESGTTSLKNEAVDRERELRGLPPAAESAKRELGDVWDAATKEADADPRVQDDLIAKLKDEPRAVTDRENALLLHRQITLQNQHKDLSGEIVKAHDAGDKAKAAELRVRLSAVSDQLLDLYHVGKTTGAESARGLNARRMIAREDYTLAAMETAKRAANDGRSLTPEENAQLRGLHEKIEQTQKAFDDYVARADARHAELQSKVQSRRAKPSAGSPAPEVKVSESRAGVLDRLIGAGDDARKRLFEKYGNRLNNVAFDPRDIPDMAVAGAGELARLIKTTGKAAKAVYDLWKDAMVKLGGEGVAPHLDDIWEQAKAAHVEAQNDRRRLQGFKTRTTNRIMDLADRLADEDFSPKPKPDPIKLDEEGMRLKAEAERMKEEFQQSLQRDRLRRRSLAERAQDTFVQWRRGFVLSSPVTLAKLTSAAIERKVFTPIEEVVGAAYSKALPAIAKQAPREGGLSVRAEARAITEGFTKGMRDAWDVLRTGRSDLDVLHGGKHGDGTPPALIDFIGHLHGALKSTTKRNEFERSFQKRAEHAIANGIDPTDPAVQTRIAKDAYVDANRAIFMQDNRVVRSWKMLVRYFEAPDKTTGRVSPIGKALATTAKTLLPIVKVPTNVVAETFQYALGSVEGSRRLAIAYARGIKSVEPAEADAILRLLKKGSLGAAGMAIGFFGADHVGGYYQRGQKRDEKDVEAGGVRVFGLDVPRHLVHNPLLETLQIGATIRRVMDSRRKKSDAETQGAGAGVAAAAMGLIEEVPMVETVKEIGEAVVDPAKRDQFAGRTVKSIVVPAGVEFVAKQLDKDDAGEPVKRKPEGVVENIESAIPGLRKRVPAAVDVHRRERPEHPSWQGPFSGLSLEKMVPAFERMGGEERERYARVVRYKIAKADISDAEKAKLLARLGL